jgi:DNA-binding transcriptional ArsR family regulator
MRDYKREEKFLSALASSARLEILNAISDGFVNPGEIAEKLDKHRSSIEKHLHILLVAGIIEKMPSLNSKGQLSIRYRINNDLSELLSLIDRIIEVQNRK